MTDDTSKSRMHRDDVKRLRDVLRYLPGSYSVDIVGSLTMCVTAYSGPSPLSGGIDLEDPRAVQVVRSTLGRLQIPATVSPNEGVGLGGVRIGLTTMHGVGALADWATSALPSEGRALQRLHLALSVGEFRHPDRVASQSAGITDLHLDVDLDIPKLRPALGLPEDDTVIQDARDLYPYAERFATALGEKLGADPLDVGAYPYRPFCDDCSGNVLVIGRLTPEQADRVSSALEAAQASPAA